MSIQRVFNEDYLQTLILKDSAQLQGTYEKLHGGVKIKYLCKCSKECEKLFRDIAYYGGAFCKECVIKNKSTKIKETCQALYGVPNVSQVESFQKKRDESYIKHYGTHPRKTKEVQDKFKATCLKKYNVENVAQAVEIKAKIKETFLENYGGHPMTNKLVKEKVKTTCFEKYGGYPAENDEVKKKMEQTFIQNYGSYPTQNKEIMDKIQHNSKKYKHYTMPSGQIRLIQGYEPFAIRDLLQTYTEEQIVSERKDIPRFSYTIQEKKKYYFPDVYIPSTKLIIEVKSDWTYEKDKYKLEIVKQTIEKEGYSYEVWIYNTKGIRISQE